MKNIEVLQKFFKPNIRYLWWIILAFQILFLTLPLPTESTVMLYKNLKDLANESSLIVKGIVIDIQCKWNPEHTLIISYITIAVKEQYKGLQYKQTVIIEQIGGELDGFFTRVVGAPEFKVGEEVVLFLEPSENDFYHVHGMFQGKYKIEGGKAKHLDDKRTLPWEDFERKIKDVIKEQLGR